MERAYGFCASALSFSYLLQILLDESEIKISRDRDVQWCIALFNDIDLDIK